MAGASPQPAHERTLPGIRWVRISLRTAHLIAMGMLLGGVAAGVPLARLDAALLGTLLSGAAFAGLELFQSPVFLVQVKGVAVALKLGLLGVAWVYPDAALAALVAATVVGGFSSHMPGKYRYYSLLHRRVLQGHSG